MDKTFLAFFAIFLSTAHNLHAQETQMSTYCNPLNLDYTYMIYNADKNISYRSGADPAVVRFKDEYYMFVTRSLGYWHSTDLLNWSFITPEKWYFQGSNAPAAHNYKDSVLYVAGDPSGSMSVLYTDNPKKGDWKAVPSILNDLQDPDLFIDDDGKAYMFWGSSNVYPIRAKVLDKNHRFSASDSTYQLFGLDMKKHGWERFGENHSDTVLGGYMEGAWLTKHNNKYYMQYAAPGTEFNVYADGVYMSDSVLGPYHYAPNNPVFYKPGGFSNGSGHGSTVVGPAAQYWHFASAAVNVNVGWERRICMYPAWFDKDGLMYSNTSFGDYPHFAPPVAGKMGQFTGWMLLSYKKAVKASSFLDKFPAENISDENVKTFWVAQKNDDKQWLEIDMQRPGKVYAVQINYHDYKSDLYGRVPDLYHRYIVEGSVDGKSWTTLVDRSNSFRDVPNDYVELGTPSTVRYVRYKNIHVPMSNLSISDFRVFGIGEGKAPSVVKNFSVVRQKDPRDAMITWNAHPNCQGYNILWGIAPDKLYNSWMVYNKNSLLLKSLTTDQHYYFAIEAFNENGVSARTKIMRIE
ncbi:family 43 glycosylhydrolase [Segetibacter koreensis]|uniref:family 43 glycosylhydrolase n=1 Tax=Segetibacter koreensis TaxID=398037 RepID=UPI000369FFD2|nr:family 43 glycosylhydrolase [Segetibacter koreensis]